MGKRCNTVTCGASKNGRGRSLFGVLLCTAGSDWHRWRSAGGAIRIADGAPTVRYVRCTCIALCQYLRQCLSNPPVRIIYFIGRIIYFIGRIIYFIGRLIGISSTPPARLALSVFSLDGGRCDAERYARYPARANNSRLYNDIFIYNT